jgi:fructoselysine-6-phosphate deglycase
MFNFDEERFLSIQSGAVGLAGQIDSIVEQLLQADARHAIFLGTGGAGILMQPAQQLLAERSAFGSLLRLPAELVLGGERQLGPQSIVVMPSLSGTTKESIAALEYCRQRGARIVALVGHADTPLARGADHVLANFAEDDTSSESFYLQSLLLVLSILRQRGELDGSEAVVAQLQRLPALLLAVKRAFEPRAEQFAEQIRHVPYHIITGAGSTWPEAFYYGMCILEEMQWIRTRPVHASDFFHGTLELLERDVSILLFKGEDAMRPLVERVESFARKVSEQVHVFDCASFDLPGISPLTRSLISPILLATVLERVSAHLEHKRNHPLTTRRYYKRVPY